jgi:hypothetical protein
VFCATNLTKEWHLACAAAGLGKLVEVEGKDHKRYHGLLIHDLRCSAIKNLIKAGVNEKVAMTISGNETCTVFDRYHIVDSSDVVQAMRRVEHLAAPSEGSVRAGRAGRTRKQITA